MDRISQPAWGANLALLLTLFCGFCRPASAKVVYVNQAAAGKVHDGISWLTALVSVRPAMSASKAGDQIWVAGGTYAESVTLKDGVLLYGGFSGNETDLSQRNWTANETVLDPGVGRGDTVVISSVRGCTFDGFAVRHGEYGVLVSGPATVANCTVSGSTSCGVYVLPGPATISNCELDGDVRGTFVAGKANCTSCIFDGNFNGVTVASGTLTCADCIFSNNAEAFAVLAGAGSALNSTLVGNSYALYVSGGGASVSNCIVAFNQAGVYRYPLDVPVALSHNDLFANSSLNLGDVADPTGSNGNISADPRFRDIGNGDYHLMAGSPCVDAGDDTFVAPSATDIAGRLRICGARVDMGAYEWQPLRPPWSALLGTAVSGGVTVAEKVAYVGGNDGKLYARSTEDGSVVPGFPVDINAAVGATVKLPSRPAVYYGKTGKAIYLTTDRGDVVRVLPTGQVAWHVRPLTGQTVSTPAVTADGYIYVNLSTGLGRFSNYVFKLDETTGTPLSLSPFLGYTTTDNIGDFSPAANSRYLYVNSGWGSRSGLTLLNQDNLAVRSSFAGGEQCLSPLLLGSDLILASKSGKSWKMNAVTLAPDLGFGHFGVADLGSPISAAPFSDAAGNVYIGTADGRILKWAPGSGSFRPFYTTTGTIAGLTIDRAAAMLGFGTSSGSFVQVPLLQPTSATTVTPGGPISTGTVYESSTDRFIVVTDDGVLSGYASTR